MPTNIIAPAGDEWLIPMFMLWAERVYGKNTEHNLQLLFDAWVAGYDYGIDVSY
jgi:hypothetical protein